MGRTETVVEGTIQRDGTLVLDQRPNLPPGRVTVVLRLQNEALVPMDDPFWQRMQAMWAIPTSEGIEHDGGADTVGELRRSREEWHQHQEAIERLQDECRAVKQKSGESER